MTVRSKKIKVGLIIDEFFGGADTAYGGYGFLARRLIAKYIPGEDIKIDILLGVNQHPKSKIHKYLPQKYHVDNVDVFKLPKKQWFAKRWLKKQDYDIYLSIELTYDFVLKNEPDPQKKLILWIQDPRPMYEWDEINTVRLFPEPSYYNQDLYDLVHRLYQQNRVKFISQAPFLNAKAIDLYRLNKDVPIQYLPNPIDIDYNFDVQTYPKKDMIIFLGRIESVKRGWLFCEIAKKMPEYEFYILGQPFRDSDKNSSIMSQYENIPNLHFIGHVDGEKKNDFLKNAKILVNTSIHEALPVSFLEALSYGTLLVSNRNPENLTSKFGIYVGEVLGDGFDKVDLYVDAIRKLIQNDEMRKQTAEKAIEYVKEIHNIPTFVHNLRKIIKDTINN
ncbi:glycosyltransferase family 4 protein [Neisseria animaloris]|uniref:Uncharacterized protein conserved in bacteria n=1 Tax=Neisseria animaloris TaxID=326522 RepID=A0A448UD35_9NEIS|nr:glycosyltransferase family 4 protein [Neisseria animaloris]VEJ21793.1 Uncharacterized protein conserved in bacteria [Neisseria animaloris]